MTPTQKLEVSGTVKATAFQGSGAGLTNVSVTDNTKVAKAGDTMTGVLNLPANGLTVGTNQLVISGGKVGIGTSGPGGKLEIAGGYATTGLSPGTGLNISSGGTSPDRAQIWWGDSTGWKLHFGTRDSSGNFVSRVTFVDSGNVGIGTAAPTQKLDVAGNISVSGTVDGVDISSFKSDVDGRTSKYVQFGNLNDGSKTVGTTWVKLATTSGAHTFTKSRNDTKIEVFVNSRFLSGEFSGANGIHFQARIDDLAPNIGNDAAILTSNAKEFLSIFAVYGNLTAGSHTVSIWARTAQGSSSGVVVDPGGWGGKIIVKETW